MLEYEFQKFSKAIIILYYMILVIYNELNLKTLILASLNHARRVSRVSSSVIRIVTSKISFLRYGDHLKHIKLETIKL
jgi:hypothetical protein